MKQAPTRMGLLAPEIGVSARLQFPDLSFRLNCAIRCRGTFGTSALLLPYGPSCVLLPHRYLRSVGVRVNPHGNQSAAKGSGATCRFKVRGCAILRAQRPTIRIRCHLLVPLARCLRRGQCGEQARGLEIPAKIGYHWFQPHLRSKERRWGHQKGHWSFGTLDERGR